MKIHSHFPAFHAFFTPVTYLVLPYGGRKDAGDPTNKHPRAHPWGARNGTPYGRAGERGAGHGGWRGTRRGQRIKPRAPLAAHRTAGRRGACNDDRVCSTAA